MVPILRIIYFGGVLLWVSYVLVFPTWAGRSIVGVFGLKGDGGRFERIAPIWNPPTGWNSNPPVRLPGQPAIGGDRIEFAWVHIVHRWSVGVVVLGFIVGAINLVRPSPSSVLPKGALAISLSLVIALLLAHFMGALGATDEEMVVTIYLFAALAGFAVGFGRWIHAVLTKKQCATEARPSSPSEK
jgi:hypothetical protein